MSAGECERRDFETIILPHLGAVTAYAKSLARDHDIADELVQDTMLRALRAFGSFKGQDAKPWLLAIVRNRFYSIIWRRNRLFHLLKLRGPCEEESTPDLAELDPESWIARRELMRTVDGHIAGLPHEFREVLVLRELGELSYREISERINVPLGTVMSRLHRARAILRSCLTPADFC